MTVDELFELIIPTISVSIEKNRTLLVQKHLKELLPPNYLITEFSKSDTFNYAEKRRKEGACNSTALREITTLSSFLDKAPLYSKN